MPTPGAVVGSGRADHRAGLGGGGGRFQTMASFRQEVLEETPVVHVGRGDSWLPERVLQTL